MSYTIRAHRRLAPVPCVYVDLYMNLSESIVFIHCRENCGIVKQTHVCPEEFVFLRNGWLELKSANKVG